MNRCYHHCHQDKEISDRRRDSFKKGSADLTGMGVLLSSDFLV
jgi:hypothetical protein